MGAAMQVNWKEQLYPKLQSLPKDRQEFLAIGYAELKLFISTEIIEHLIKDSAVMTRTQLRDKWL